MPKSRPEASAAGSSFGSAATTKVVSSKGKTPKDLRQDPESTEDSIASPPKPTYGPYWMRPASPPTAEMIHRRIELLPLPAAFFQASSDYQCNLALLEGLPDQIQAFKRLPVGLQTGAFYERPLNGDEVWHILQESNMEIMQRVYMNDFLDPGHRTFQVWNGQPRLPLLFPSSGMCYYLHVVNKIGFWMSPCCGSCRSHWAWKASGGAEVLEINVGDEVIGYAVYQKYECTRKGQPDTMYMMRVCTIHTAECECNACHRRRWKCSGGRCKWCKKCKSGECEARDTRMIYAIDTAFVQVLDVEKARMHASPPKKQEEASSTTLASSASRMLTLEGSKNVSPTKPKKMNKRPAPAHDKNSAAVQSKKARKAKNVPRLCEVCFLGETFDFGPLLTPPGALPSNEADDSGMFGDVEGYVLSEASTPVQGWMLDLGEVRLSHELDDDVARVLTFGGAWGHE